MIQADEVPQISGDMDALAQQASSLISTGMAFASTGAQVHATWQGLAGVYDAPEAGDLLGVMIPVREVSNRVGGNIETVGHALATYAATVKPIKERLETLALRAQTFGSSVAGHDWSEDAVKVGEHNQLLSMVNEAVADWVAAQRTCANAISATYAPKTSADTGGGGTFADVAGFAGDAVESVGDWLLATPVISRPQPGTEPRQHSVRPVCWAVGP
jgi:hypothetical protein